MTKTWLKTVVATIAVTALMGVGQSVHASIIAPLLTSGNLANILEDDSSEALFRDGALVTTGLIQQDDVIVGIFDLPIVNGQTLGLTTPQDEATGIFVFSVTNVQVTGLVPETGNPEGTVTFGAATAADWLALTGIDTNALGANFGFNPADLALLLYEDPADNLTLVNPGGDDYPTAIANATDGTLRVAGTTGTASATNLALLVDDFADPTLIPGVSVLGDFNYNLPIVYDNFPGWNIISNFLGSGSNLVNNTNAGVVQDDTQVAFTAEAIPEPSVLFLIGAGLLGFARSRRALR